MNLLTLCLVVILCCATGYGESCNPSVHPPEPNSWCCGVTEISPYRYKSRKMQREHFSSWLVRFHPEIDQNPWMGLVEYRKDDEIKLLCGAFLISSRYALSAAQCFPASAAQVGTPINVRLGDYDLSNTGPDCTGDEELKDCNDAAVVISIEKIIVHPDYQGTRNNRQNDIALIRLKENAPYTDFIRPICLPASDISLVQPLPRLTLAGWGSVNQTNALSDILHQVDLPLVDSATCISAFNGSRFTGPLGHGQLCAGGEGKDACSGDSGNPLVYNNNGTLEVAGIVSFGINPCGQVGKPGVYTKVFAYKDWILENIVE